MRTLIALLLCAACGKNSEPPPPSTGSPNAPTESGPAHKKPAGSATATATATGDIPEQAKQMFMTVCATCHGSDGTGNGPAAEALSVKPRNYTDAAWQASVTDEELKKTILLGGQGVGKSPLMPGNPQLQDQPEVLDGLVRIIRGFAKQ